MRLRHTTTTTIISTAILTINLLLLHNKIIGVFGVIIYFLSLSLQVKKLVAAKSRIPLFWSFFILLCSLMIALTVIYYAYAINKIVSIIILWLPLFTLSFRAKRSEVEKSPVQLDNAGDSSTSFVASLLTPLRMTFLSNLITKTNILSVIALLFELVLFFQVYTHRTENILKSPWQALSPKFFLLYTLTTATLIIINYFNKNNWIKYLLTSTHLFLTYSIAAIIYPLGFGIDGFIHRATENYIQQNGIIVPKQPFYVGQYSLVVWLSNISAIPIFYIDIYLVPILSALFIPGAISEMLEKTFGIAKKYAFSLTFLVPFIYFINLNLTTPHNLAILLSIITLSATLICASDKLNGFVPIILAVAGLFIHPLLGMPLLIFVCLIIIAKKFQKNKIAFSLISTLGLLKIILAVPILFFIYLFITKNPLPELTNPLNKISFFFELLKRPYWYSTKSPIIFELLYYWEMLLAPVVITFGLIAFFLKKQKNKILLLFPLTMIGFWMSAFFLRSWILFPNLSNLEQGDYPLRLLKISLLWILPWIMWGIYKITIILTNITTKKIRYAMIALFIFVCSFALTLSFYLSYPQENFKVHFPGYNVTTSDFKAVKWIHDDNNEYNYIVLSNPLVAIASMTNYGFVKYFDTENGMQFYYSTPSGSVLADKYLHMWFEFGQNRQYIDEAMDFVGVKKAYFVIPSFWTKFDKIVAGAKKTANSWQSIDDGKIYIFTYIR